MQLSRIRIFYSLLLMGVYCNIGSAYIDVNQIDVNDIQSQLPTELSNLNITLEDAKTLIRDKCVEIAGDQNGTKAFEEIETGVTTLSECVINIVNYTAIKEEIDEASPRGELDAVFNKYCNKRQDALDCVENFNAKFIPCLDKEERDNQDVFMRIVRSLLGFICHKGGDQIALFIAEKGPECLESKKDDIQQCLNNTLSSYMPKDGFNNVKSLPKLVVQPKQCAEIEKLEDCIVQKLTKCEEITPANIVESMFRFIKNETICRTTRRHNDATLISCNFIVFTSILTLFFMLTKILKA